uniref:Wsv137-like protein n=1 Tax=Trachysalambria curvirostris nimavirus TaxID=2984282 RepID=A0A9C7CED0_9VIRU|nr:MAG: wsv137-like protein [Trachysalambria curvirostris nimavirus]
MLEILLCTEAGADMLECANACVRNFSRVVRSVTGALHDMTGLSSQLPGSKICLSGSGNTLKEVLFYSRGERFLDCQIRKKLVSLANALGRSACLSLSTIQPSLLHNFDFSVFESEEEESVILRTVKGRDYIVLDFSRLILDKISIDMLLPRLETRVAESSLEIFRPIPSKKLNGIELSKLLYDDTAGSVIRNIFMSMPENVVKKTVRCIAEEHTDSTPSMRLTLKPFYWRYSKKIDIAPGLDIALEEMYRSSSSSSSSHPRITREADNAVRVNGHVILLYICSARCYSTNCDLDTILTNDKIKEIK